MKDSTLWLKASQRAAHNGFIVLLCGVLLLLEPGASTVLALNRKATLEGYQLWRLVTGHWVHLSPAHFFLNAAGLALIVVIFIGEQNLKRDLAAFIVLSISTSLLLLWCAPDIGQYVGLSGVLHGYFIYYLAIGARTTPWINLAAFLGISAKVFHEQMPGYDTTATAELIHGQVAVNAHLYGYLAGSVLAVILTAHWFYYKSKSRL